MRRYSAPPNLISAAPLPPSQQTTLGAAATQSPATTFLSARDHPPPDHLRAPWPGAGRGWPTYRSVPGHRSLAIGTSRLSTTCGTSTSKPISARQSASHCDRHPAAEPSLSYNAGPASTTCITSSSTRTGARPAGSQVREARGPGATSAGAGEWTSLAAPRVDQFGRPLTRSGWDDFWVETSGRYNVRAKLPAEAGTVSPDRDYGSTGSGRAYSAYHSGSA
jgi:hypothetical protein